MEVVFALFIVVMIGVTIRGYIKTKEDEKLYKLRVEKMSDIELWHQLINFNSQVRHMPGLVRRNSSDGVILAKAKVKSKIVLKELKKRNLV